MKPAPFVTLVLIAALLAGCETQQTANPQTSDSSSTHTHADGSTHDDHGHGHSHDQPPHGGTIADWGGGKYHIEFVVDQENQQAMVYILGDDVKTATPIAATEINLAVTQPNLLRITLQADPQDGEDEGQSSRFVGTHEELANMKPLAGTIFGEVEGTSYSGDFEVANDSD